MQVHTKKPHTDDCLVTLKLRVHRSNLERLKKFVSGIEPSENPGISLDDFYLDHFADQSKQSVSLKGLRYREDMTQRQLTEATGIPQRHISEMENGKRSIGKENARKLAVALKTDYRVFL